WLPIEIRHTGYSRLFPHWCKGCFGHVCRVHVKAAGRSTPLCFTNQESSDRQPASRRRSMDPSRCILRGSCWIPGSCIRQWRTLRFLSFSPPCRPSFSRAVTMRSASRTPGEHKTPESNKSDLYNTTGDLAVQPEEVESSVHGIALLSLSAGGYTGRPCVRHG